MWSPGRTCCTPANRFGPERLHSGGRPVCKRFAASVIISENSFGVEVWFQTVRMIYRAWT